MSLVSELDELNINNSCSTDEIGEVYERIVSVLINSEKLHVPRRCKKNINSGGAKS